VLFLPLLSGEAGAPLGTINPLANGHPHCGDLCSTISVFCPVGHGEILLVGLRPISLGGAGDLRRFVSLALYCLVYDLPYPLNERIGPTM